MANLLDLRSQRDDLKAQLANAEELCDGLRARITKLDADIAALEAFNPFEASSEQETSWQLYSDLMQLRSQLAQASGLGTLKVFDDLTLERIVRERPKTELALHQVQGMSAKRLKKYGDKIVSCILQRTDPGAPTPPRPYFLICPHCTELQVLAIMPTGYFLCKKCQKSKDPSLKKPTAPIKLPTQKDFD
jgi:HRDC domain